jgi:hypothetical protein
MQIKCSFVILVGKILGKRTRKRAEDNIRVNLREVCCKDEMDEPCSVSCAIPGFGINYVESCSV